MNKIYYAAINKDTSIIEGYYVEELHGKEVCEQVLKHGGIPVSEELWQELLSYNQARVDINSLSAIPQTMPNDGDFCFGMEHCEHFSKVKEEHTVPPAFKSTETDKLKEEVAELKKLVEQLLNK